MRRLTMLLFAAGTAITGLSSASASEGENRTPGQWHSLKARYLLHSGGASYPEAPSKSDRALTILFEGAPAKQVFNQMGPDAKETCSTEKGDRERRNKGALCIYTARLSSTDDVHYRCWIGIDLRTGDGDMRVLLAQNSSTNPLQSGCRNGRPSRQLLRGRSFLRPASANRTVSIALQANAGPLHAAAIKQQQAPNQRLSGADDEFQRFGRLHRANYAHERGEHAHAAAGDIRELLVFRE